MALIPDNETDILDELLSEETEPQPSKTYYLDFENGRIGPMIDGDLALRQFIIKTIMTPRSRYLIYDDEYGTELEDLIGADVTDAFLQEEIPRVIREALIYDDRIADVRDFVVRREKDVVFIEFTIEKVDGETLTLTEEVTI
jgi:Protein of unknown function (DUF2634)